MKIAVASLEKNINSEISSQTGRSPYFLIFEEGELIEVWKNVFSMGGGGAGLSVAKIMFEKGVNKIIGGNIGENVAQALENKNITFEERSGRVRDVIQLK
ncbi:MAG: NifB/NifX family molybdenum-iron cluster-binding protein [Candidatus Zambryskibacteria bacterium]|nr:NifB/NifX family molybdenum-iron cluster-binding protein [Candidatus Zambryskibacteria bacterium]